MEKPSPSEIVKLILGKFGDRDIEVKTASDDGGSVAEIHLSIEESPAEIRSLIPLTFLGWRVVIMNFDFSQGK